MSEGNTYHNASKEAILATEIQWVTLRDGDSRNIYIKKLTMNADKNTRHNICYDSTGWWAMEGKMRIKNVSSYSENKNHKYKVENLK